MWRIAFISTLLFLGVSAGALYYQWDEYHTEATKQSVLQHDIEAKFTGKRLKSFIIYAGLSRTHTK